MPPTLTEPPALRAPPTSSLSTAAPQDAVDPQTAERLRTTMAATRVSFTWFGVRKSLSTAQREQAADSFAAEAKFLSAAKKLLDTQHAAYRAVTAVKGRIQQYWRGLTLPFPEPGLRLIRQQDLTLFDARLQEFRSELQQAVAELDDQYAELRLSAQSRLGELYNPADYPPRLQAAFGVSWEFPSVEPPNYLAQLQPTLYAQECQRVQAQFSEAVQLAEQAFLAELSQLVDHLAERLSGTADGRPKVFRDSAVDHLTEFFARFQRLNIGSNAQLEGLVAQAQQVLRGVDPQRLRAEEPLRQRVATQISAVQAALDGLLVDRPRRVIVRTPRPEAP